MSAALRVLAQPAFARRELNPYNWQLSTSLQAEGVEVGEFSKAAALHGGYHIWHLHWPEGHLGEPLLRATRRSAGTSALLWRARARGTRIVWTIHNLQAHERRHPWLERWFRRAFLAQVDGVISLSRQGEARAMARFPQLARVPRFVIPHGHYRQVYPNGVSREAARARLGIASDARVLGCIGLIREYKNVPALVAAVRGMSAPDVVLLVAGRPASARLEDQVRAAAGADRRMHLRLGLVPDADMQLVLNAADLVVLPYREILNSGSALLALSFDRPVLVPDAGALPELRERVGPEWVRLFRGPLTPAVLEEGLRWARAAQRPAVARLDAFEWPAIARATLAAYREVLAQ